MSTVTALLKSPGSVGGWRLVPERSTIAFKTKTLWGLVPVTGRFTEFSGEGQISDTGAVSGRLDIKAASLNTGLRKRDDDLREARFFDVANYPDIKVVVTGAEAVDDDTVNVGADLTVRTTTAPLPLRVKVTVLDDGAVRLLTEARIDRKAFGVTGNMLGMVGDTTVLSADVVFTRAAG
jgi:polyisoprenoid-binding protein YceI